MQIWNREKGLFTSICSREQRMYKSTVYQSNVSGVIDKAYAMGGLSGTALKGKDN